MPDVNWDLLKFKYEVLEYSLVDLAEAEGIPISALEHAAQKWEQVPLAERKPEGELKGDIRSNVVNQAQIFTLLKQQFLNPKYIELETTLLHKALELANKLDTSGATTGATKTLQILAGVMKDLLTDQKAVMEGALNDESGQRWEINIVGTEPEEEENDTTTERTEKVSSIRN